MPAPRKLSVIPCGVGLVRKESLFLIAQRHERDTFGSFWEFPGGKKRPGESFEECVVREVREELGIRIRVDRKFMEVRRRLHEKIIRLHFYLCSHVSGEPQPLECRQARWAGVGELKDYRFPPANERVIERLVKEYA